MRLVGFFLEMGRMRDPVVYPHKANLTAESYHLVRVFMVNRRLPNLRVAVQQMIELAAKVAAAEEPTRATTPKVAVGHEER